MLSKNELKFITSLSQKKYRIKDGLFIAEGVKLVNELIQSRFEIYQIYATSAFETQINPALIKEITVSELKKISLQVTPNAVVGLFKIPKQEPVDYKGLTLVLDGIQDPGNLGTIIRLCDWFGIPKIVCSPDTVDCFNPKVVQATMGSIARVEVCYQELESFISKTKIPVFYTLMEGSNLYEMNLPQDGIIVMGNEANGISENLKKIPHKAVTIPRFGENSRAESLNVSTATAVLLSEFRRKN